MSSSTPPPARSWAARRCHARGFLEDDSVFDEVFPQITEALEDAGAQGVGDTHQLQQVVRRTVGKLGQQRTGGVQ